MKAKLAARVAMLGVAVAMTASLHAEPVNISYQPALYWSLPFYIASEKGWWKEVGIEPTFSTFAAGPQQIAAAPSKSWDIGGTGSPPAVLGAVRFGLKTIAITDDQSETAWVVARKEEADAILKDPSILKGKQILLTTNSTAELTAVACLKNKFKLQPGDMQTVNLGPPQTIQAFASGNGTLAAQFPAFSYVLEEKSEGKVICTGKEAGAAVTAAIVVREDYAKEHPDVVTKVLAVYLRSISWQKKHRAETMAYMKPFFQKAGTNLSDHYIAIDYDRRPIFDLAQQFQLFDRSKGASTVDKWHTDLADYLKGTGTLKEIPDPKSYITDEFLKRIDADPKLKAFANKSD